MSGWWGVPVSVCVCWGGDCHYFTNWLSLHYEADSRDLLERKLKSPLLPKDWGLWLQKIGALYAMMYTA